MASADTAPPLGSGRSGWLLRADASWSSANGVLGIAYMAVIAPFRYLIVYPRMMRDIGDAWQKHVSEPTRTHE